MPAVEATILSYGMGVESTAILLRWCLDEDARRSVSQTTLQLAAGSSDH